MTRLLDLCRAIIGVGLLLFLIQVILTPVCGAYSVLTHEEVVDLCGKMTSSHCSPSDFRMRPQMI